MKKKDKDKSRFENELESMLSKHKFYNRVSTALSSVGFTIAVTSTSVISAVVAFLFEGKSEELKNQSFIYWLVGIILFLVIALFLVNMLLKYLKGSVAPKELILKEQIILLYSNALDKTFINPDYKS